MKEGPTIGNGKICYLEIPSSDIKQSSKFYQKVFGWHVRQRFDGAIAFDDGVYEVSGVWVQSQKPSSEVGVLIYIMVNDAEKSLKDIQNNRGEIIQPIGRDLPEITARFKDSTGNIFCIYQHLSTR